MKRNIVNTTMLFLVLAAILIFYQCPAPSSPTEGGGGWSNTATLVIKMSADCSGKASNMKVYIDDGYSGTLQPGNQLSKTVSVGDHKIYARSDEGAVWGPFSVTVTANGLRQTLSCGW